MTANTPMPAVPHRSSAPMRLWSRSARSSPMPINSLLSASMPRLARLMHRLLVVHRLAAHVVAVGVEHGRYATAQLRRFIEQSGYPHARIALVAELANSIARTRFDRIRPLDPRSFVEQAVGVAAEK